MGKAKWWVCDACKSLNDLPANKCYNCRSPKPPNPVLMDDQYDHVGGGSSDRVGITVDLSKVGDLTAPDPLETAKGGGIIEAFEQGGDDAPGLTFYTGVPRPGDPAGAATAAPPPMREPEPHSISELGARPWTDADEIREVLEATSAEADDGWDAPGPSSVLPPLPPPPASLPPGVGVSGSPPGHRAEPPQDRRAEPAPGGPSTAGAMPPPGAMGVGSPPPPGAAGLGSPTAPGAMAPGMPGAMAPGTPPPPGPVPGAPMPPGTAPGVPAPPGTRPPMAAPPPGSSAPPAPRPQPGVPPPAGTSPPLPGVALGVPAPSQPGAPTPAGAPASPGAQAQPTEGQPSTSRFRRTLRRAIGRGDGTDPSGGAGTDPGRSGAGPTG